MTIVIGNQAQQIVDTNYWETPQAASGYFYLSWNAGAARLLIPDNQKHILRETKKAKEVIISRGPWTEQGNRDAVELMWEDNSDAPFILILLAEQCDRMLPDTDQGRPFVVTAWTKAGQKARWPGKYRRVQGLPYLQPW